MQAPLLIGCDVRNMTAETLVLLTNEEVIAVNQGNLSGHGCCIILFNLKLFFFLLLTSLESLN